MPSRISCGAYKLLRIQPTILTDRVPVPDEVQALYIGSFDDCLYWASTTQRGGAAHFGCMLSCSRTASARVKLPLRRVQAT